MFTFLVLLMILIFLILFVAVTIALFGTGFIIVFGDIIVCIFIIAFIIKKLFYLYQVTNYSAFVELIAIILSFARFAHLEPE